jgi:sugar/nucleoside kinase (ribokinase family)
MDKLRDVLIELKDFLVAHRIDRALLSAIPSVGTSLDILIYGDDVEKLVKSLHDQTEARQLEIVAMIREILKQHRDVSKTIVAIGSGNAENILKCKCDVEWGSKHQVSIRHEYGGSAVNVSTRLLSMGYDVYPVITIGRDRLGTQIRHRIHTVAEQCGACGGVLRFLTSEEFQDDSIETPSSTVIIAGGERTIFSQPPGKVAGFRKFMERRLDIFSDENRLYPRVVMIGHIYADDEEYGAETAGECTISIINRFRNRALIYANFGNSQIRHRSGFWKEHLRKIDVFQLNIREAKNFFQDDCSVVTLADIIKWFMNERINAVITLDKFGAVATHRSDDNGVFIAWPIIRRKHVKDTTGAGDAFAAGMASVLCENPEVTFSQFQKALDVARSWAAEACTHEGASSFCPNAKDIEDYGEALRKEAKETGIPLAPVAHMGMNSAYDILSLIEIAFS